MSSSLLKSSSLLLVLLFILSTKTLSQRTIINLNEGWKFSKGENTEAYKSDFNDKKWQSVSVPHDWAIYGPFDKEIDKQMVRIEQNNEEVATEKTGRTGSLPFIGVGWYRNSSLQTLGLFTTSWS